MAAVGGEADAVVRSPKRPLLAETVEELVKKAFSVEISEHCQFREILSY